MGCGSSTTADDPNNNGPVKPRGKKSVSFKEDNSVERKENLPELKSEPDIEEVDVPKAESGYPPVKIPKDKKDDIFNARTMKPIDEHARQTPPEKGNSYEELISYLTSGCKSDVEKVRSVFMWLGNQDIATGDYSGVTDSGSPHGFMKLMKENKASYSSFFALLCRKSGIPCVIVDGYAKSVGYKVGDLEDKVKLLRNSWNAVYCGGGWRIVFPLWACAAVTGYSSGAYTKVEAKGQAVREREVQAAGQTVKILNEFYFFTNPESFVFVAFPIDSRWQLLQRKWDFAKFVDVPYCRQPYFSNDIIITSDKFSCRLNTKDGECKIELTSEDTKDLSLDYELYYDHEDSGKDISSSLQLNNYVLLDRSNSLWNFGIRFPESGVYKLQIVGGRRGWEADLCAFRINCDKAQEDCKELPYNPGKVGYGPNQDTEIAGIKAISHKTGVVKMYVRKTMEMNFTLTRDVTVKTQLMHSTIATDELTKYIKQKQKHKNVNVKVTVPEDGEYALVMYAQQKNEPDFKNVCNYLLTSDEKKKKKNREWETPIEKRTRNNVQSLAKSRGTGNIEELEKEVDRFHKLDLTDKGELAAGEDALEFKKDKKELEDAIKRRHMETLEKAILRGKQSRFKDKLAKQITEAEDVRDHLVHLNKIAHDVLEMKQPTISELRSYKYPQPIIYDIMKATFLMLGENEKYIEDWEDLQVLMGKMGRESMIRRVKTFDTVNVQPDNRYRVEQTLNEHAENDVRKASAGAGTFYVWLRDVCKAINQQDGAHQSEDI